MSGKRKRKRPGGRKPTSSAAVHRHSEDWAFVHVTESGSFIKVHCANFTAPGPRPAFEFDLVPGLRGWFRPGSSTPIAGPGEGTAPA